MIPGHLLPNIRSLVDPPPQKSYGCLRNGGCSDNPKAATGYFQKGEPVINP